MIKKNILKSFVLLSLSPSLYSMDRVIYGDDNRQDLFQVSQPSSLKWAQSTALITRRSNLTPIDHETFRIKTNKYGVENNLCPTEAFVDQWTAGHCSGFLVAEDILVTAGHCVKRQKDCDHLAIVFGYGLMTATQENIDLIRSENLFTCREIIASTSIGEDDFAIIKLDRTAGRDFLSMRRDGQIEDGQSLLLIGHPRGLPTKIVDGALVSSNQKQTYFSANTDSFAGNSGSVVMNAETGVVEGVLVRGADDFKKTEQGCRVNNTLNDAEAREDITRITQVAKFLPQEGVVRESVQKQIIVNRSIYTDPVVTKFLFEEQRSVLYAKLTTKISHLIPGNLIIEIVAPNGTIYRVKDLSGDRTANLNEAFIWPNPQDINSVGEWQVRVFDVVREDIGKVESMTLELVLM